ncbi:hypothetical protein AVEN_144539-1 [Araneus ventricosus]|uniref:Uncharacterized protein n=1 Tax=Araneus ventricosus TaxID=182803 RepID=A0A4Y2S8X2_ARAVE|nr:hypothetical protein AVEN_144539-1 [Araneus ventricosus]
MLVCLLPWMRRNRGLHLRRVQQSLLHLRKPEETPEDASSHAGDIGAQSVSTPATLKPIFGTACSPTPERTAHTAPRDSHRNAVFALTSFCARTRRSTPAAAVISSSPAEVT